MKMIELTGVKHLANVTTDQLVQYFIEQGFVKLGQGAYMVYQEPRHLDGAINVVTGRAKHDSN